MAVRVAHAVAHRPIYASVLPRNNRTTPPHLVSSCSRLLHACDVSPVVLTSSKSIMPAPPRSVFLQPSDSKCSIEVGR